MKVKALLRELKRRGWRLDRVSGSHHVFVHPNGRRNIVVPIHGAEIPDHFAKGILRQAHEAVKE